MTTEQINKAIQYAEQYRMSWIQLAKKLTEDPFNLTAADATKVLDEYKRRSPARAYLVNRAENKRFVIADLSKIEGQVLSTVLKTRKKHEHTPSALVRAATKEFALAVSGKKKNGKFRRVGKKFIQTIEADLENIVRDIGPRNPHSEDDIPGDWDFVNHLRIWPKLAEQLNRAIRRRIFERVMSQPSIGKTLK